jgi:hypothetical protein
MPPKARITSDFPTPTEVASWLQIPEDRAAELRRQLFDLHVTHPDGSSTVIHAKDSGGTGAGGRNHKKTSGARRKTSAKKK